MENNPVLYGRYDLYSESDICDFFVRNRLDLVCIQDDDTLIPEDRDHVGEYFIGFAGFRHDRHFLSYRDAFEYIISHPLEFQLWFSFIANHCYHTEIEKSENSKNSENE